MKTKHPTCTEVLLPHGEKNKIADLYILTKSGGCLLWDSCVPGVKLGSGSEIILLILRNNLPNHSLVSACSRALFIHRKTRSLASINAKGSFHRGELF